MLDRMYSDFETCECCNSYFFEESIDAIDADLVSKLYLRLNRALSPYWCGAISFKESNGQIVGYEYDTEDYDELERIDDIKKDIAAELEGFKLVH
jgi:hypothetical protein